MAFVSRKSSVVFINEEVTEGVAVNPSASLDAVGILADGFSMDGEKELVERNVLRSSIGKAIPLTGIKSAVASIGVEAAANETEGSAPESDLLLKSLLAGKRTIAAEVTSGASHTASVINIADVDIGDFNRGDIVVIKEAGAFHMSPITEVDDAIGAANITLLVPMASAPSDAVVIAPATIYYGANSGHSNLTVSAWMEGAIKMQASGCKVASMSLDNFSTGQLPSMNFSLNGMNYVEAISAQSVVADFDSATPPLVLSACVYMDGVQVVVQDVSLSVDNTVGRITSTCEANGIKGQLIGERAISGSFTAYMSTLDVAIYDKFNANTEFSLFLRAQNPSGVPGETQNHIGVYLPKCIITGQPKADSDGVVTIQVAFQAGFDANNEDIFMAFV